MPAYKILLILKQSYICHIKKFVKTKNQQLWRTRTMKRFDDNGYDRHKIFLYKEDFNKFIKALGEAIDYVKTDLRPDFDFDAFNHEYPEGEGEVNMGESAEITETAPPIVETPVAVAPTPITDAAAAANSATEEVDKW